MFSLTPPPFKIILLILLSFLIASCSEDNPPLAGDDKENVVVSSQAAPTNEAAVEHIDIVMLESFPVPVSVVARGHLPDNCTTIDQITELQNGNTLTLKITTARQTDKVCTKMIKPFEQVIPLDIAGLSAGVYTVKVNSVTDIFELGIDNITP